MEVLAVKHQLDKDILDVLSVVQDLAGDSNECTTSEKYISDETGKAVNHVRQCLKWLRNHGFIECSYKLLDPHNRDVQRKMTIRLLKRQEISL